MASTRYGSLLDAGHPRRGLERPCPPGARHLISRIVADGDCVEVGRLAPQQREFGNVFTARFAGLLALVAAWTPDN
ncbi:hypothetical protein [Streptomyces sp. NPDC014006]|uniref:hypothetical protein n=1 Tax=Streptomyces sp. NPDC014006 TaxID=3364870 RepID=UPI0037023291